MTTHDNAEYDKFVAAFRAWPFLPEVRNPDGVDEAAEELATIALEVLDPMTNADYVRLQEALDALERTYWNLKAIVAQQPVRDLAETYAEAESVLLRYGRMEAR